MCKTPKLLTMKNSLILLFSLFSFSLLGQLDTMIAYDLETQTYEIIPPVQFDASVTNDRTPSSIGTLEGLTILSNEVPTTNLFAGTDFTQLAKTVDLFDLTHYPMRTSVKLEGISKSGQELSCSGTLVANNMVLTAAHCAFDFFTIIDFYVQSMEVLPSFDGGELPEDFPSAQVKKVFLTKKSFDGESYFDVCLLLLDDPIGEALGYQGFGLAPIDELTQKVFHKMSYPATASTFNPAEIYSGDSTYYNYGLMSYDPLFGFLELDAPGIIGIGGQSGSGLFESIGEEQTLYGVMSFSNYQHLPITPNFYFQFKNIIESYQVISSVASVENNLSIQIQPNPFDDFTTVILPNDIIGEAEYQLIDLRGTTVQLGKINNQTLTLRRNDLVSGIYVLSIILEDGKRALERIVIK